MGQCVYISKIKILKTFLHKQKRFYGKQLSMREKNKKINVKYGNLNNIITTIYVSFSNITKKTKNNFVNRN